MIKTILSLLILLSFILVSPLQKVKAAAADINLINPSSAYNSLHNLRPSNYLTTTINLLFGIAGVVSFIYLLVGGIQWITAGGDKEAIDKARKKLVGALIGLAIVFAAYAIIYIPRALFNINSIQVNLTPIAP